jgi:hypothetical protein
MKQYLCSIWACATCLIPVPLHAMNCERMLNSVAEVAICGDAVTKSTDDLQENRFSQLWNADVGRRSILQKQQLTWQLERDYQCQGNIYCLREQNKQRAAVLQQAYNALYVPPPVPQVKPEPISKPYIEVAKRQPSETVTSEEAVPAPEETMSDKFLGWVKQKAHAAKEKVVAFWESQPEGRKDFFRKAGVAVVAVGAGVAVSHLTDSNADDVPEEPRGTGWMEGIFAGMNGGGESEASNSFTPKEHHYKHEEQQTDPYPDCNGGLYGDCHNENYQSWK